MATPEELDALATAAACTLGRSTSQVSVLICVPGILSGYGWADFNNVATSKFPPDGGRDWRLPL